MSESNRNAKQIAERLIQIIVWRFFIRFIRVIRGQHILLREGKEEELGCLASEAIEAMVNIPRVELGGIASTYQLFHRSVK